MASASADNTCTSTPMLNDDLPTSPVHQLTEAEMADAVLREQVQFISVKQCYPPSQDITLRYSIGEKVEVSSHDWVGVYKVGWKAPKKDYFTFVWSPGTAAEGDASNERSIVFTTRYLPTDRSSYQFCYVTRAGDICGVSSPFQIREDFTDDDLECVELDDEVIDAVLVQSRERRSRDQEANEACISDLQASVMRAELELEDLKSQVELLTSQKNDATCEAKKMTARSATLEAELRQITEEFQKEKALSEESIAKQKTEVAAVIGQIESKLTVTVSQLEASRTSEVACAEEISTLKADISQLSAQVSGMRQELADAHLTEEESAASIAELKTVNEQYQAELEELSNTLDLKLKEEDQMTGLLNMANERTQADKAVIDAKDEEIRTLNKKLVDAGDAHTAELDNFFTENRNLRDENIHLQRSLDSLQDEATALRIGLDQTESADINFAASNVAELMGESEALKTENAELISQLQAAKEQVAAAAAREAAGAATAVSDQGYFALQKAFEDSQRQCEKWKSASRKHARVSRTAEATVRQLESEVSEQRRATDDLTRRVTEGASHYKTKYLECEELKRKLQRVAESSSSGAVSDSDMACQCAECFVLSNLCCCIQYYNVFDTLHEP